MAVEGVLHTLSIQGTSILSTLVVVPDMSTVHRLKHGLHIELSLILWPTNLMEADSAIKKITYHNTFLHKSNFKFWI